MSEREGLERATDALRGAYDGSSDAARMTEARIVASASRASRRRQRRLWILAIAAAFAASTAWAAKSGRLTPVVKAIANAVRGPGADRVATHAPLDRATPPALPTAAEPVHEEQPRAAPEETSVPPVSPSIAPTHRAPIASPLPKPSPGAPSVPPDADALYREAHEAHFVRRDSQAALAAWDRYLAAAPNGKYATEARYNRALTLIRLGRNDEAAEALRPFANGDYGPYRQSEAKALLERISGK